MDIPLQNVLTVHICNTHKYPICTPLYETFHTYCIVVLGSKKFQSVVLLNSDVTTASDLSYQLPMVVFLPSLTFYWIHPEFK